jgi:glucose-1-phosphate adenylyltransferase
MDHLGSGKAWDLSRKKEGLYVLTAQSSDEDYDGRLKPLIDLESFVKAAKTEYIVMTDSYVVGSIDYAAMLQAHVESGADITVAYINGTAPRLRETLLLSLDDFGNVRDIELDMGGDDAAYGIGLYVLSKNLLLEIIHEARRRGVTSFERDCLQHGKAHLNIHGYEIKEWTAVIYSLQSYFAANMALLDENVRKALFLTGRPVYTKVRDCAPAIYGLDSHVSNSLVADGSHINGKVKNSIIFRDVSIAKHAVVENSIVMQGSVITQDAQLNCVILDKNVTVKESRRLQGVESYPLFVKKGVSV